MLVSRGYDNRKKPTDMTTHTDTETKRHRGRPRKPQLVQTGSGYSLRYWRTEEGETVRRQVDLETASKVVARQRMKRIVEGELTPEAIGATETFESAARRIVSSQNIASQKKRMSRLARLAFPIIGNKRITEITATMVKDCIQAAIDNARGKRTSAVKHLFVDIDSVLGTLFSDDELPENVCKRIKFAKAFGTVQRVRRPRIILSDAEFVRFATYYIAMPEIPEVVVMAIASRFLGGMRTSDLHAWLWEHIDTRSWATALVPRPKTEKDLEDASRHAIDRQLAVVLRRWWEQEGRPVRGPVFPARLDGRSGTVTRADGTTYMRHGVKAGQAKNPQGVTYAPALRDLLFRAGVIRPMAGYEQAEADGRRLVEAAELAAYPSQRERRKAIGRAEREAEAMLRQLCEIQTGGATNSPVDFHSFRRAIATAAARAGLTPQEAMAITDHSDVDTYMGYVRRETVVVTPEKLLPRILPPPTAEIVPTHGSNSSDYRRVRSDSNGGPIASEGIGGVARDAKTPVKRGIRGVASHAESPLITGERQKPTALIQAHSGAPEDPLRDAIKRALDDGDDDLARDLLDLQRSRRAKRAAE
jgi:integrase